MGRLQNISIHALREEGDGQQTNHHHKRLQFQSTPSARRATNEETGEFNNGKISIHALREEGDTTTFITNL